MDLWKQTPAKQKNMVLSKHCGQKTKAIVNNSTKSVIWLSYTDLKDKLIFLKQSSDLF